MRLERSSNSNSTDPARGLSRAKAELHELENKMRRKVSAVTKRVAATSRHEEGDELPVPKERHGIVSINGQDVETIRCCGPKRSR